MFFLIYASSATKPFTSPELLALLDKCHTTNNYRLGVTGMLLYKDGNFLQLLEGEEESVRGLYERIAADPRHRGIIVFLQGYEDERQFPEWSMGFRDLSLDEEIDNPGYNEFLNTQFTGEEFCSNPTRAQKLFLMFKRTM